MAASTFSLFQLTSLQHDLNDLSQLCSTLSSITPSSRAKSWKYPDQAALEVDAQLIASSALDDIDDSDDGDFQHALKLMLELIIDRYAFLVSSLHEYVTHSLVEEKSLSARDTQSSSSIGISATRLVQCLHNMQKERASTMIDKDEPLFVRRNRLLDDVSDAAITRRDSTFSTAETQTINSTSPRTAEGTDSLSFPPLHSNSNCSLSCQTVESSLIPCENCNMVQKCLRQAGEAAMNLCNAHRIPSALMKFSVAIGDDCHLSAGDILQWSAELSKDYSRIQKFIRSVYDTIDPLKETVENGKRKMNELKVEVDSATKRISDAKQNSHLELIASREKWGKEIDNAQALLQISLNEKSTLQQKLNAAQTRTSDLEYQLNKSQRDAEDARDELKACQTEKAALESTLSKASQSSEQFRQLAEQRLASLETAAQARSDLVKLQAQLDSITSERAVKGNALMLQLSEANERAESFRLRYESQVASRHTDRELTEKMQSELNHKEHEMVALNDELEKAQDQSLEYHVRIDELDVEVEQLEKQLNETVDDLKSVVQFPELQPKRAVTPRKEMTFADELEQQIKANRVRIRLLSDQTFSLEKAASKLANKDLGSSQSGYTERKSARNESRLADVPEQSIQLWADEPSITNRNPRKQSAPFLTDDNHNPPRHAPTGRILSAPPARVKSATVRNTSAARGPSGQDHSTVRSAASQMVKLNGATSIGAYKQAKRSGYLKYMPPKPTPSARSEIPSIGYICKRCDQLYFNAEDLKIHKEYCNGAA